MLIPPNFSITSKILFLISKIDALRLYFSSFNLPKEIKNKIQRASYLKSSLYSARIEGNPLAPEEFDTGESNHKQEIFNILSAIKHLESQPSGRSVARQLILNLHQKILNQKTGFRQDMSAIYNQAGEVVYLPPPPSQIISLIDRLIIYIDQPTDFPLISGLIAHLIFEKIHPFLDGNGRTGRLLINAVLKAKNYDFGLIVPYEEYLDNHKSDYYHYLDVGLKQTEDYLLFMLEAIYNQAEKIKQEIANEHESNNKIYLPPRQNEIYLIIKEHKIISFNFLKRRFLKIPPRTLHYDLKKLVEKNLIVKIGKTRGCFYQFLILYK